MKRVIYSLLIILVIGSVSGIVYAKELRTLKGNMTLQYNVLPGEVEHLQEMFTKGEWYGRIRLNTFLWDWDKEDYMAGGKKRDNWAIGIGGSIIYKTAYFRRFGATVGIYTTQNPWHMDTEDVKYIKAGKDTFSRYKVATTGRFGLTSVAQAYIEYKYNKSSLKIGRQIFESLLTKSNDTKMIPNTFEGYSFSSRYFPKTTIKFAYFTRQKLRDHENFHDVITFGVDYDGSGAIDTDIEKWANNDDSAANKALNSINFQRARKDTHHNLIVTEVINKSIPNFTWLLNYTTVPGVVALGSVEAHYAIKIGEYRCIPGFRYIKQWDKGANDIGALNIAVANLKSNGIGYKDPYSIDSWLFAARVDLKPNHRIWWMRIGYSKVADKADIIAPWRGFPTGGFTRAMAQYNWYANTETWMIRGVLDFDKAQWIPGLSASLRYAMQDFDDTKQGVQADSDVVHLDLVEKVKSVPGLYLKFRIGLVFGDENTYDESGRLKNDPSYNEYRFEVNYLF